MSETPVEPTPAQEPEKPEAPEIDWKSKAREWERRAKENKAAADKLAELEEAQKSAEQKAAERLAEAERKAADAEFRIAVADIAGKASVPTDIATGPADRTAEAVQAYVDRLVEWVGDRRRQGNHVPREGNNPPPSMSDEHAFVRSLFGTNS